MTMQNKIGIQLDLDKIIGRAEDAKEALYFLEMEIIDYQRLITSEIQGYRDAMYYADKVGIDEVNNAFEYLKELSYFYKILKSMNF